jgi:sulfoxide reductase heme-binding subunit YedZ
MPAPSHHRRRLTGLTVGLLAIAVAVGAALLLAPGAGAQPLAGHAPGWGHSGLVLLAAEGDPGPDAELRKEAALAGYLCYGLMAATMVWGMFLATGWARKLLRRNTVYAGHMVLAVAAQAFGIIHALSYVLQTQEHFTIAMTFIPFAGGGEPEVATGVIGLELTIAASLAVLATRRLNYRRFRIVHVIGVYLGFALSWIHVLATSAEAKTLSMLGVTVAAILGVCVVFAILRLLPASRADRSRTALELVTQ